jgi:hypothetical protein
MFMNECICCIKEKLTQKEWHTDHHLLVLLTLLLHVHKNTNIFAILTKCLIQKARFYLFLVLDAFAAPVYWWIFDRSTIMRRKANIQHYFADFFLCLEHQNIVAKLLAAPMNWCILR